MTTEQPKPNFDVIFVTAAELPTPDGLYASQILEPAAYLRERGYSVTWIAAIPLVSYLKSIVMRKDGLRMVKEKCRAKGIELHFVLVPLTFNGVISFPFRKAILGWAASKLLKKMKLGANNIGKNIILHGRSYYATQLAINLRLKSINNMCISFDMRSISPEEMPVTRGWLGKAYFGFSKQWEHELLRSSDAAFLPLNYARERIKIENGCSVKFSPIQGLERGLDWQVNFEERWMNRYVGYAGSIGFWHDPELLKEMFRVVPDARSCFAMHPRPELKEFLCVNYPYNEMGRYYDNLLVLIIPGRMPAEDYFINFMMRCNCFSTKAAEALSRGVPLFVSSELKELADFVEKNDCGFIYDPNFKKIIYPSNGCMNNKETWSRLTENAKLIGDIFTRENVLGEYLNIWQSLIDDRF